MSQIPLQRNITEVVPLRRNIKETVPLQKQDPSEPIKPMFTPEEARAMSAAEQARLNSADWINKYRAALGSVTPRADQLSMQDQISTAMKDPVYGQATATGLSSGQNMLNSWIAGINAKSRMDERNLENERWIKQLEDANDEKNYRREQDQLNRTDRLNAEKESTRRYDESLKEQRRQFNESRQDRKEERKENRADRLRLEAKEDRRWEDQWFVPGETYEPDAFAVDFNKNPAARALMDELAQDVYAKTPSEKIIATKRKQDIKNKLKLLNEASRRSMATGINPDDLVNYKDFTKDRLNSFLYGWIPGLSYIGAPMLTDATTSRAMKNAGYNRFAELNPSAYLEQAEKNLQSNDYVKMNLGAQQKKIHEAIRVLTRAYGNDSKVTISPDGSVIVVSGPHESTTITPKNAESIIRKFELSPGE